MRRAQFSYRLGWLAAGAAVLVATGCGGGAPAPAVASGPAPVVKKEPFTPDVNAGIPIPQTADVDLATLAANRSYGGARSDPFALMSGERSYDAEQTGARILQESGGYALLFTPPTPIVTDDPRPIEPQPYRRLSGILVGDSVYAIIELEGGRTEIVRPGTRIPNTEWTVVSIDHERAVLRRDGNRRPTEIVVRLESRPFNQGGGGGNAGGRPAGGRPGGGGPTAAGAAGGGGGGTIGGGF